MPLPPRSPATPPKATPPALPAWQWPLILGLAGLGLALSLGFAGRWGGAIMLPVAGFTLAGLLLIWLGLGRRYRARQTLAWHSRERSWN